MSPVPLPLKLRWGFSASLLFVYLVVFHVWMPLPRVETAALGVIAAFGMTIGTFEWRRRGYFVNNFDHFAHLVVALDVLLEGLFVPVHIGYGFYVCALAFSIVIGGYRLWKWRKLDSARKASGAGNESGEIEGGAAATEEMELESPNR